MKALSALAGLALLGGCAHAPPATSSAPAAVAATPVGVTPRNQIVPLLDAHQHMMSPAAMALAAPRALPPAVTVPPDLSALLTLREGVTDATSYRALFAEDAVVFAEEHGRWWTGETQILDALDNFPKRRFVPVSYAAGGAAGYVSGNLRNEAGEDTHNFILGLRKAPDGRWRIASEMKQRVMPPHYAPPVTAETVIAGLDDAGIRYGVVLSLGYWFGRPGRVIADPHAGTRGENDWTVAEAAKYPDRLIPFCGVNPLADYAVAELERCAAIPSVRGMKIHRQSQYDLTSPEHVEKFKRFFRAANTHGLAVVMHTRGAMQPFIDEVLPEAPDVPIQIAHMTGSLRDLDLFADAIEAGKPGTRNLYFDWTQALPIEGLWGYGPSEGLSGTTSREVKARLVELMRRVGMNRILFGTDMPLAWNPSPREWWRKTVLTLPLTDDELRDIADNLPPYVRPEASART